MSTRTPLDIRERLLKLATIYRDMSIQCDDAGVSIYARIYETVARDIKRLLDEIDENSN